MTFSESTQLAAAGRFVTAASSSGPIKALTESAGKKPKISVSGDQLRALSAEISRDFAPVFPAKRSLGPARMKFFPRELLDISEWISRVYRPRPSAATSVMLLPIDPEHVYVYWNLEGLKPGLINMNTSEQQLALRIFRQTPDGGIQALNGASAKLGHESWLDLDINQPVQQLKLSLPAMAPASSLADASVYSAVVGLRHADQRFEPLPCFGHAQLPIENLGKKESKPAAASALNLAEAEVSPPSSKAWHSASGQR